MVAELVGARMTIDTLSMVCAQWCRSVPFIRTVRDVYVAAKARKLYLEPELVEDVGASLLAHIVTGPLREEKLKGFTVQAYGNPLHVVPWKVCACILNWSDGLYGTSNAGSLTWHLQVYEDENHAINIDLDLVTREWMEASDDDVMQPSPERLWEVFFVRAALVFREDNRFRVVTCNT